MVQIDKMLAAVEAVLNRVVNREIPDADRSEGGEDLVDGQVLGCVVAADEAVATGQTVMVEVSVADLPYWHLPPEEAGEWGYPIAVVGADSDRYEVDDRNSGRLTVAAEAMARALQGASPDVVNKFLSNMSSGLAMVDPEGMPAIVEGLARMDLADDEIRGILGGNWMRVAKRVWK